MYFTNDSNKHQIESDDVRVQTTLHAESNDSSDLQTKTLKFSFPPSWTLFAFIFTLHTLNVEAISCSASSCSHWPLPSSPLLPAVSSSLACNKAAPGRFSPAYTTVSTCRLCESLLIILVNVSLSMFPFTPHDINANPPG